MSAINPHIDAVRSAGFPTVEQLRRGIVLSCITHSFWLAVHDPVFYMFWDESTYFEDQIQGEYWAVAFTEGGAVVVFYSSESERNPFPDDSPVYDQARYFKGMPQRLNPAKDRALSLMIDLDWQTGNPSKAAITAAMWADGERFTAAEPWTEVFDHSLWACNTHLLPPEAALQEWWRGMDLLGSGERAAWSLYQRRLASTAAVIAVEPWEWRSFVEAAEQEPEPAKLAAAQELLASVGIALQPQPNT
ncbi:MAG: hypothetical protein JNM56_39705 [Planctomycetia bacterium]|nr:hypothetical protein [Planctomycetia bacterium]